MVYTVVGKWLPTLPSHPTLAEILGFCWTQLTNKLAPLFTTTKGRTPRSKDLRQLCPWVVVAIFYSVSTYCGLLRTRANSAVAQMRGKNRCVTRYTQVFCCSCLQWYLTLFSHILSHKHATHGSGCFFTHYNRTGCFFTHYNRTVIII